MKIMGYDPCCHDMHTAWAKPIKFGYQGSISEDLAAKHLMTRPHGSWLIRSQGDVYVFCVRINDEVRQYPIKYDDLTKVYSDESGNIAETVNEVVQVKLRELGLLEVSRAVSPIQKQP